MPRSEKSPAASSRAAKAEATKGPQAKILPAAGSLNSSKISASALSQARLPANLFAGTSGWAYPTWKPGFYPANVPAKRFLEHYATQLSSVEVNYTFRTLPTPTQLAGWLAATPPSFRFSFKAPQRITHFKRLRECDADILQFLAALEPVQAAGQLGLLLFQFPPNFQATGEHQQRLASLLAQPALLNAPLAFEFRHPSWFDEAVYTLLRQHDAALCIAESDDLTTPEVHTAHTRACFRLRRDGGYTARELKSFAARLTALAKDREVYAYFKHEDEPTGALNAVEFLRLASQASQKSAPEPAPPATPRPTKRKQ